MKLIQKGEWPIRVPQEKSGRVGSRERNRAGSNKLLKKHYKNISYAQRIWNFQLKGWLNAEHSETQLTNAYHLGISELHNAHIEIMGNENDIIDMGVETLEAGW